MTSTFPFSTQVRQVLAGAFLTVSALATAPARAQQMAATLDVGGSALGYGDSLTTQSATLAPSLRLDWARGTLAATGSASRLGSVGWSSQGEIDASVFTPSIGPIAGELAASAGGAATSGLPSTRQALGVVRAHLMGTRIGAWGGVGGGGAWDGAAWRAVRQREVGGWVRASGLTALASVIPTTVDDTLRYTDATASLRLVVDRLELGASVGGRTGRLLPAYAKEGAWGSGSATMWFLDWAAVTGSVGTYPIDLMQGFPGGRYVTLALRIGSRPTREPSSVSAAAPHAGESSLGKAAAGAPDAASRAGVLNFTLGTDAAGSRTFRVRAPRAQRVEVTGDFSGWLPVPLARNSDGWWTAPARLAPGTQQIAVRIDGGAWLVPPGLQALADEFGGVVGLLMVR